MATYQIFLYWIGTTKPETKFVCFIRGLNLVESACMLYDHFGDSMPETSVQYGVPMYVYDFLYEKDKADKKCKAYVFDTRENARKHIWQYLESRSEVEYIS